MKYTRHARILEIIENFDIETQEDLCVKLKEQNFNVTQATVSRDIKDLKLIKVINKEGKYKYAAATDNMSQMSDKMLAVFAHAFISADYANNVTVVKTLPGMAQAVASTVDSLKNAGILGSIGGDDTVMIMCRTEKHAEDLVAEFQKILDRN